MQLDEQSHDVGVKALNTAKKQEVNPNDLGLKSPIVQKTFKINGATFIVARV